MTVIKRTRTRAPVVQVKTRTRVVAVPVPETKSVPKPATGEVRSDKTLRLDSLHGGFAPIDPHMLKGIQLPVNEVQEYVIRVKIHGKKLSFLDVSQMIDDALLKGRTLINDRAKGNSYVYTTLIYAGVKDKDKNHR